MMKARLVILNVVMICNMRMMKPIVLLILVAKHDTKYTDHQSDLMIIDMIGQCDSANSGENNRDYQWDY